MLFFGPGNADSAKWPLLQICYTPATTTCNIVDSFIYQTLGGDSVQFTNTSTDTRAFTSSWAFSNSIGQFSTSNATNPLITFTGQPPYSAQLIVTDSLCADTLVRTISLNHCLSFQYGTSAATGAEIATDLPNSNFDYTNYHEFDAEQWTVGGAPDEDRGLLKYDLSAIPVGSVIVSATLSLYADTASDQGNIGEPTYGNNNACYLHLITSVGTRPQLPGTTNLRPVLPTRFYWRNLLALMRAI